jgi:hypothetical protein
LKVSSCVAISIIILKVSRVLIVSKVSRVYKDPIMQFGCKGSIFFADMQVKTGKLKEKSKTIAYLRKKL